MGSEMCIRDRIYTLHILIQNTNQYHKCSEGTNEYYTVSAINAKRFYWAKSSDFAFNVKPRHQVNMLDFKDSTTMFEVKLIQAFDFKH